VNSVVLGRNAKIGIVAVALVAILLVAGGVAVLSSPNNGSGSSGKIQVVAAENFWGSLVSQLGGERVQVLSIVSDPNADPHEYESNTSTARAIATADYIIINGAGYDSWAQNLINSGTKSNVKILNVADLLGKSNGDNPHFWYDPSYVNQVVSQMKNDLTSIDSFNSAYYQQQYANLTTSLGLYQQHIAEVKQKFAGTNVAATEDIFAYLAAPAGLDLISPPNFMQAVAEGNDPSAQDVVTFEQQLRTGNVSVLVYNQQTITQTTENMKSLATQNGIPIVGITETIQPPNLSFQDWMNGELIALENALNTKALGG
jgi:zinc/manganese transport system substrate-binding protein